MAITIKDIAKRAGVSISTVSKVINDSPEISQKTIEHVKKVIDELNYHPNKRARSFVNQCTKNIVFITYIAPNEVFSSPHTFEVMCGAQDMLKSKKYSLTLESSSSPQETYDLVNKIVFEQSADGVILLACPFDKKISSLFMTSNFPHMIIAKPDFESSLCWIDTNNYVSGKIAAKHLYEESIRKIAFVGGEQTDLISHHRLEGVKQYLDALDIDIHSIYYTNSSHKEGYDTVNKILSSDDVPQALICANNNIALGALNCLQDHKVKIPNEVAMITFDDYPFSQLTTPKMSVVNIDMFALGEQAASFLIKKVKNPSLLVQSYTTLPSIIVRGTTVAIEE